MSERKPDTANWLPAPHVRPVILGALRRGTEILVMALDDGNGSISYRLPGGGQDFQETMEEALIREFSEELNVAITVGNMIGIFDYIYEFKSLPGHDVNLVFNVTTSDKEFLARDSFEIHEPDGRFFPCKWAAIEDIRSLKIPFFPEALIEKL